MLAGAGRLRLITTLGAAKTRLGELARWFEVHAVKGSVPIALVALAGSWSRDEVTFHFPTNQLLSDCDVVVVVSSRSVVTSSILCRLITHKLNRELAPQFSDLGVSISAMDASTKQWSLATPEMYELLHHPRIILGDSNKLPCVRLAARDIPMWEGVRLVCNRSIELLCALLPSLDIQSSMRSPQGQNALAKLLISLSDARMLQMSCYKSTLRAKESWFLEETSTTPELRSLFRWAVKFKLNSVADQSRIPRVMDLELAYSEAIRTIETCTGGGVDELPRWLANTYKRSDFAMGVNRGILGVSGHPAPRLYVASLHVLRHLLGGDPSELSKASRAMRVVASPNLDALAMTQRIAARYSKSPQLVSLKS